jgi:hypothetical protein
MSHTVLAWSPPGGHAGKEMHFPSDDGARNHRRREFRYACRVLKASGTV